MCSNCKKRHCIDGCIHYVIREIPGTKHDDGMCVWVDPPKTVHTCELYPEKYYSWMEKFGQVPRNMLTPEDYSCFDECYVPNEGIRSLDKMIDLAQQIIDKIDKSGD